MSGTLMDERFLQNKLRAEHAAYRIGLWIAFFALVLTTVNDRMWIRLTGASDPLWVNNGKLLFLTVVLSLAAALAIFLSQYLLYRYDHEPFDESEF